MHITTRSSHEGRPHCCPSQPGACSPGSEHSRGGTPWLKGIRSHTPWRPDRRRRSWRRPASHHELRNRQAQQRGDYPRHRRSTAPGREGSQGQWRQRRRRPGGAKPADSPPTTVSSNRRPSHNTRDRARANLHYNHHNPCSRPLSSLHNGNRKCKQLLAAPGPLQPPAPTPHTRGRNSSNQGPRRGTTRCHHSSPHR